ncbi:MAG: hypothetical protein ACT4O9_13560 [Blastocatellia bacterium]
MSEYLRFMFKVALFLAVLFMSFSFAHSQQNVAKKSTDKLKEDILKLANSFAGQGDPDYSKQRSLESLVDELLTADPQPTARERLPMIQGAWKQVWGPYDYRGDKRGVDPELGVDEIYQVVFPGGFYYNVTPLYKNGDRSRERIGLLKGRYKLDPDNKDALLVIFVKYPGLSKRPSNGTKLFELPGLLESKKLKSDTSIVSGFVVSLFFGGGALKEVYTDRNMRILYGAGSNKFEDKYLYIMTRVGESLPSK